MARLLLVALLLGLGGTSLWPALNPSLSGQTAANPSQAAERSLAAARSLSAASPPPGPLGEALTLYRKGDFDGAIRDYQ